MQGKTLHHLYGAKHVRLEELLVAVGMIDQGAIVDDGVYSATELLIFNLVQTKIRPC